MVTNQLKFEEVFGSDTQLIKIIRNYYNGKIVNITIDSHRLIEWLDKPYEEPKENGIWNVGEVIENE